MGSILYWWHHLCISSKCVYSKSIPKLWMWAFRVNFKMYCLLNSNITYPQHYFNFVNSQLILNLHAPSSLSAIFRQCSVVYVVHCILRFFSKAGWVQLFKMEKYILFIDLLSCLQTLSFLNILVSYNK